MKVNHKHRPISSIPNLGLKCIVKSVGDTSRRYRASPSAHLIAALVRTSMLGIPRPVTASHPLAVLYPRGHLDRYQESWACIHVTSAVLPGIILKKTHCNNMRELQGDGELIGFCYCFLESCRVCTDLHTLFEDFQQQEARWIIQLVFIYQFKLLLKTYIVPFERYRKLSPMVMS